MALVDAASRWIAARRKASTRSGATYVMVLGATLIVATVATGGMFVARAQIRNFDSYVRTSEARQYALSAIELGIQEIGGNSNWRTAHKNDPGGIWYNAKPIGNGTYTLKVINPSGALDRSPTDPVVLTATGTVNNSSEQQIVELTLVPSLTPKTCLQSIETSASTISFGTTTVYGMNGVITANSSGTAVTTGGGGAKVYARVEAVGTISGTTYYNGTTSGATARTLPDPATAFDYYIANGTAIDITGLPISAGVREFSGRVLTPASNPFGATNAEGIYVIDCQNQAITFSQNRIAATLVLLNTPTGGTAIYKTQNHHAPAVANYPCLLVRGDFQIQLTSGVLSESSLNINYNPPGSPYPWTGGTTDIDKLDSYPNRIEGLMYVSGNMWTQTNASPGMLIVGGAIVHQNGQLELTYFPIYNSNPPHGFYTLKMVPSAGSWQQRTQ